MKTVNKSVLIWYSPEEMFRLVTDVTRYSQFLPWCDQSRVVSETESGMIAELGIAFAGLHQTFTTQNHHETNRRVELKLLKGPFSNLEGCWNFHSVGSIDPTTGEFPRACKVELSLSYGFDNRALAAVVGPVFDKIASSMVDAFIQRAEQVYG